MGYMDRISAIEMRMQEIQGRFGSQPMAPTTANMAGQGSFQSVMGNVVGSQMAANGTGAAPPTGLPGMPGVPGMPTSAGLSNITSMLPQLINQATTPPAPTGAQAMQTPPEFESFIQEASSKWGVDDKLIRAVIQQESAFNPSAKSGVGAAGLMQLMPDTARSLGVTNSLDPRENILGGTRYLKGLLERFNNDPKLALAAYNAGPGNVQKYGGIPPFAETQNYVQRIMGNYERMKGQ